MAIKFLVFCLSSASPAIFALLYLHFRPQTMAINSFPECCKSEICPHFSTTFHCGPALPGNSQARPAGEGWAVWIDGGSLPTPTPATEDFAGEREGEEGADALDSDQPDARGL